MHVRVRRSAWAVLAVAVLMGASQAACGGDPDPVEAGAGAEPTAPTPPAEGAEGAPTTVAPTTAPTPPGDDPSTVDGLTADELRQAVEAPPSDAATTARRRGPVAEQVTAGGSTVWRITIPARVPVLSSAIVVAVGGTDVGEGVVGPDQSSLVVVTADAAAVVDGAAVSYRWGAGEPTSAGNLAVVR